MTSDAMENLKKAAVEVAKEQIAKIDKYGIFIVVTWISGLFFIFYMQRSLGEDPFRRVVILIGLAFAIGFPLVGVIVYAGLDIIIKNSTEKDRKVKLDL